MKALYQAHQSIIEVLEQTLKSNEFVDFDLKKDPKKWSKKEILGHLVDSAYNNHRRFLLAPEMEGYNFDGYEQESWVVRNRYQEKDSVQIINLLIVANRHFMELVQGMSFDFLTKKTTDHNLHKTAMLPVEEGEPKPLSYFYYDYLYHLEHHLKQVFTDYMPALNVPTFYRCI